MWLTRALCALVRPPGRYTRIPGRQYIGKKQKYRPISKFMVRNTYNDLEREAQNQELLSMPFMTLEQDIGHMKTTGKREKWLENFQLKRKLKDWPEHKMMEDHFKHLLVSRKWE